MKNYSSIPVVILAGGLGTRLREETEFRPKPMVPIGGKPILWHIMKSYAHFGFNNFIVCLGYKGEVIKDYFLNYWAHASSLTISTQTGQCQRYRQLQDNWQVTLVDTGIETQTAGRLGLVKDFIKSDNFLMTYGDGLSSLNNRELFEFHVAHTKLATLTAVYPPLRFGKLEMNGNAVTGFFEKETVQQEWVNGGFMALNKKIFKQYDFSLLSVFERDVLPVLAQDNQLQAFRHTGFWHCMDTLRDNQHLESMWQRGDVPWKVWQDEELVFDAAYMDIMQTEFSHER